MPVCVQIELSNLKSKISYLGVSNGPLGVYDSFLKECGDLSTTICQNSYHFYILKRWPTTQKTVAYYSFRDLIMT